MQYVCAPVSSDFWWRIGWVECDGGERQVTICSWSSRVTAVNTLAAPVRRSARSQGLATGVRLGDTGWYWKPWIWWIEGWIWKCRSNFDQCAGLCPVWLEMIRMIHAYLRRPRRQCGYKKESFQYISTTEDHSEVTGATPDPPSETISQLSFANASFGARGIKWLTCIFVATVLESCQVDIWTWRELER